MKEVPGLIYATKHGSHAYRLNTPESDLDIKGVFIAGQQYYFGFLNNIEQIEEKQPNDLAYYELRKFFRLASDCNPNIIEVLFTAEEDILQINDFGRQLRSMASLFLSQKAKFTFTGYAHSQLKRIKGHHRWLRNPPKAEPKRSDFGLPEKTLVPKDQLLDIVKSGIAPSTIALLEAEKAHFNAHNEWEQYQNWLKTRNPKRAELEAKWGYDTKHGMHLVRLMKMGREIMETGQVIVKRPDREELLAIRSGAWPIDKLIEWAETEEKYLDELYASGKSPLPKQPNRNALDERCIQMAKEALGV